MSLSIRNIGKRFGSQTALGDVSFEIRAGEFFSLLGPSGCGKSTLLRILSGLESADQGELHWRGNRVDHLSARERPFNMVFQKYALFPHLSVFENVAFGLRVKKHKSDAIRREVDEALAMVGLSGFAARLPETLSGGQAQRVAVARALVNKPDVLLLDEPLAALDQRLREHMQAELRALQRRLGLTFIFVTHDQEEAILLSDRIAVMNAGRVEQIGTPRELYASPRTLFCAQFIGHMNELSGSLSSRDGERVALATATGAMVRGRAGGSDLQKMTAGADIQCFIRPEHMRLLFKGEMPATGYNVLEGEILQVIFRGTRSEALIALSSGVTLRGVIDRKVDLSSDACALKVGERAAIEFSPDETHVFTAGAQ